MTFFSDMGEGGVLLMPLLAALILSLVTTPLVIRLAKHLGWVAEPQKDRWHEETTALSGGVAIYLSATIALALTPGIAFPWMIWSGATLLFVGGFLDDRVSIHPVVKLVIQITAAGLLVLEGYRFGPSWPVWLSVPVTFFWVIGITNAVNLLDNMDGLAAGISAIAAAVLAFFGFVSGQPAATTAALVIVGSAGGFLWYNFKPAQIFMGDCGSLFLGYVVAALGLVMQSIVPSTSLFAVLLVPAAVMAVPIFDTTLVTINRLLAGRAVSQGGRDHSSHRLVYLGLSESLAVLSLYAVSLMFGTLAVIFYLVDVEVFYAAAAYMGVGLAVVGRFLMYTDVYNSDDSHWKSHILPAEQADGVVLRAVLRHKREIAGILTDGLLVTASLILAVHLRFENGLPAAQILFLENYSPLVIVPKLAIFYAAGLYHGIWRNAGTPELARLGVATLAASLATYVLSTILVPGDLSVAVFVIDWMLTFLAIGGVRFAYRGLRQYLSSMRTQGRRVLLYGAGDMGVLSLRIIRQVPSLELHPVGFIDDDEEKHGRFVQGLPVVGGSEDIVDLCDRLDVQEVLITTDNLRPDRVQNFIDACREQSISCREFKLSFELTNPAGITDEHREKVVM